MKHMCKN